MKQRRLWLLNVGIAVLTLLAPLAGQAFTLREGFGYLLGMEEYVYGFPLVMMDVTREKLTAASKSEQFKAPINQFARIRAYVTPELKDVVRISVNSLWSHGFIDLDKEPMIVTIPDAGGRYIVVQALNMWTDDFASMGTRTPAERSGNFMFVGPNWKGATPPGIKETFRSSTRYAWILVQIAAASPEDFPAIHAMQDKLQITPLSAWGKPYTPPDNVPIDPNADTTATPFDQVRLMSGEMFFKRLARLLVENPPYPADSGTIDKLKLLGVEVGKDFDPGKIDQQVRKGIDAAPWNVWKLFASGPYSQKTANGWVDMMNLGRYGTDYETRAFVAYMGLGALSSVDAVYPSAYVDGDGQMLDAAYNYTITFPKGGVPPSKVNVWSVSQYRENFYVPNKLNRYGLLSSSPMKYNADGSLAFYLQAKSPGPDKESNWLPLPPSGLFNLTTRIYQPTKDVLDGTYKMPPVVKAK